MKRFWTIIALLTPLVALSSSVHAAQDESWNAPHSTACDTSPRPPVDLSTFDLFAHLHYQILTRKLPADHNPRPSAKVLYPHPEVDSATPTADAPKPESASDLKLTELFKNGSEPAPVLVTSSSTLSDINLEATGETAISVRNIADLSGSAIVTISQVYAKGTADLHVFRKKLGTNVSLIGLARTQAYLVFDIDPTALGACSVGALSTGAGIGLQFPGFIPHHPVQLSLGGGPMLLWNPQMSENRAPLLSGTVLGQFDLLAF